MADWSRSSTQLHQGSFHRKGSINKPPNMSVIKEELRVVLLGPNADVKASCGNTIFGQKAFSESQSSVHWFQRHDEMVLERHVVVINTPDLINPDLSPEEQNLNKYLRLSCPEPHALLLVLKSGTFTEQEEDALKLINIIFGAGASKYVIVVFMHEEQKYVSVKDSDNESVKSRLQTSRRPHHHFQMKGDQSQVQKLLESIEKMVEENGGQLKISEDPRPPLKEKDRVSQTSSHPESLIKRFQPARKSEHSRNVGRSNSTLSTVKNLECVRIVLTGKTGVGKSATGNTILGHNVFESRARMKSVTRTCQRETREVYGRDVTVVDTPGLFDTTLSNEEVQQEIMKCIELSAPGPHVFLVVIAVGPITRDERETLQLIKTTFGQKAEAYTMVLFTRGDNLSDESIEDYMKEGDPHVQQLINDCGGRFHVFNNKQKDPDQVMSLLKKIDKMMWNNKQTFYNDKMFQEAERAFRLMQINREREEEVRRQIDAIKVKHEAEIKEIKEKLEEEKAKVREFQFLERENTLFRKYQTEKMTEDEITTDTEQTHDQGESKVHVEEIKSDEYEEYLVGETDTQQGTTGGEFDQDKKKMKKKLFRSFTVKETKPRENQRMNTGMFGEEKSLQSGDLTDRNELNKKYMHENKLLLEQKKAMEECNQKMEEIKRRYKEIQEIHAAELKKLKEKNYDNITAWNRAHGNCVLL